MSTADTLVLAWHGTRNPAGHAVIASITDRVRTLLPGVTVHTAWVDAQTAGGAHDRHRVLPEALAAAGDCTLVPCFLAEGYHVTHDIPEAVAASPYTVQVAPHLDGVADGALVERVTEAGGPGDALVLAVVGSRRLRAQAEVARVASRLGRHFGVSAYVGDLFGSPSVTDQVEAARAAGASDVVVVPYTLAPGLWMNRVAGLGVRIAEPLGQHASIATAIAARHRAFLSLPAANLGR
ncbi:MAG: CbiX/SirB N-terminal domain-containing protein [Propioniciclava sp.]|uniref:sirohydrochlorin chelatase n=1 Tax=Propioniciclava sp. TaxID=2038686 RepID=UPI0039E66E84